MMACVRTVRLTCRTAHVRCVVTMNDIIINLSYVGFVCAILGSAFMAYNDRFDAAVCFAVWSIIMLILIINYDDEDFDYYV